MRAPTKLALAVVVTLAACAGDEPRPLQPAVVETAPAPVPPPAPREDGRLPPLARPERYGLSFRLDPAQAGFTGTARILTTVPAPTRYVVLHGRNLFVTRAVATAHGEELAATVTARPANGGRENEELVLAFARELPAGKVTLTLDYRGLFDDSLQGVYHVSEGKVWYAFTQFEPNDARRAFPCFDEPGYKVNFDIAVTVPKGMIAVANTPESTRRDAGDQTTFEFATTPPLPTYLVAFAVGDFDVRQGATSPVPIRLIATKGKAAMGDLALEATSALARELAGYFGIAYPYPKIDIVAVPNFSAGAMENAGLITFRDTYLLLDRAHPSARAKRQQILYIEHELAHQWFGDLVTMAWWNDLWLNEGFATWTESKIADRYQPSMEARLERLAGLHGVMDTDSLESARAVRQPVKSSSEADEAFDSLTYDKGARVLAMLEHSIGEAVFQKGVHAYLTKNAWKNATADDLLQALNEASGEDVRSLASSYLDRPGVPNVTVSLSCSDGKEKVALAQSPWRFLGEAAPSGAPPLFWVPVGVTSGTGERAAKLLAGAKDEMVLSRCAPWVFPNTDLAGYYRFSLDSKAWVEMAKAEERLDTADRIGFLGNMWAQARAGELDPEVVLRTLPMVDAEKNRFVIDQEIDILQSIEQSLVTPESLAAFRRYASLRLLPHSRLASPGRRDDSTSLLERDLLPALGDIAEDDATFKEAERVSQAWLKDPGSVDSDLAATDLVLASRRAGPERIDALVAAIQKAKTPGDAEAALLALGAFTDPSTLQKALDVALTDDVKSQDVFKVIRATTRFRATRKVGLEWLIAHWEAVKKKVPVYLWGQVFSFPASDCAADERTAAAAFFRAHVKEVEGGERPLEEALEAAASCEAFRDKYAASVTRFFAPPVPAAPKAPTAATTTAPKSGPSTTKVEPGAAKKKTAK
jgi:cytosol alanyl aminopeptidase